MKFNINDFKKVKEDKHTITLSHPRHGHSLNIAKNSLSQRLKSDFAAMPMQGLAGGGEVEAPKETGILDDIKNLFPPKQEEASTPQVDPETQAKRNLYNEYATGTFGPDAETAAHNMQGAGITFEGEKAPERFNPAAAEFASNKFDQERAATEARAKTQQAEQYQNALQSNDARLKMGLSPEQLPPQPLPEPQYQQTSFQPSQGQASVQMTPEMQNQMAAANDQAMNSYMKGFQEQKAGIGAEAKAQGELGQQNARLAQEQVQLQQNFMKHAQDSYNDLNQERLGLVNDVKNNLINPNHYMENMSAPGKISTAIGLLLGSGMGANNPAQNFLNQQIDRDIAAQANNLNTRDTLLKANLQQFGNMHDALNMTRIMQTDIYKAKIEEQAAKSASPLAQARAQQLMGQLDIQAAPLMQQLSLRQAAFRGMRQGNVDPSMIIQYAAPEKDREKLMKDLEEMQGSVKAGDNLRSAFDQLSRINSVKNRAVHPLDTKREVDAIIGSVIPGLSKETAGRFTEQDASYLEKLMPAPGESDQTQKIKKQRMEALVNEKLNFPSLEPYGIKPKAKYKSSSSFNLAPPVRK